MIIYIVIFKHGSHTWPSSLGFRTRDDAHAYADGFVGEATDVASYSVEPVFIDPTGDLK